MENDNTSEESPVLGSASWAGAGWVRCTHARTRGSASIILIRPLSPSLVAVVDNAAADRLARAIEVFGFREAHADWRDLVARDDIDVVSVTGPNFIHREVAVGAAKAGKHVWVEKPAGRNATETRTLYAAEIIEAMAESAQSRRWVTLAR
jgi:predicted dehydrogenase